MAGLNAPTNPLLAKSSGNINTNVQNLRASADRNARDTAAALENLQIQVNALAVALAAKGSVQSITVTSAKGALIGWIGSALVGTVNYFGAWLKYLYIGGSDAAHAQISTDVDGNVIFNVTSATFADLTVDGTTAGTSGPFRIEDTADAPTMNLYSTIATVLTKESTISASSVNALDVFNNADASVLNILQNGDAAVAGTLTFDGGLTLSDNAGAIATNSDLVVFGGLEVTSAALINGNIESVTGSVVVDVGNIIAGAGNFVQNGHTGFSGSLAAAIAGGYNVYGGIIAP